MSINSRKPQALEHLDIYILLLLRAKAFTVSQYYLPGN